MSDPPDKLGVLRQWVGKAEDDFRIAQHLLTLRPDCPFWAVCFHCQQSAEKYIKALLVWEQIPFGKVHDLDELTKLLPASYELPVEAAAQLKLSDFAVTSRYPGGEQAIGPEDAQEALSAARRVRDATRRQLPPEALAVGPVG